MDNPYEVPMDFINELRRTKEAILSLRKLSLMHMEEEYGLLGLNFSRWFLGDLKLIGRTLSLDEFRHIEPNVVQLTADEVN